MESNNNDNFNIVGNSIDLFFEAFNCVFWGHCIVREYDYTFYLDSEELKADYCFSNYYGRSYCELNGITYNNVDYSSNLVREYEENSNFFIGPIVLGLVCFYFIIIGLSAYMRS